MGRQQLIVVTILKFVLITYYVNFVLKRLREFEIFSSVSRVRLVVEILIKVN